MLHELHLKCSKNACYDKNSHIQRKITFQIKHHIIGPIQYIYTEEMGYAEAIYFTMYMYFDKNNVIYSQV